MTKGKKSLLYITIGLLLVILGYVLGGFPTYSLERAYRRYEASHLVENTDILHIEKTDIGHYVFAADAEAAYCARISGSGRFWSPWYPYASPYTGADFNAVPRGERVLAVWGDPYYFVDGAKMRVFAMDPQGEADRIEAVLTVDDPGRGRLLTIPASADRNESGTFLLLFSGYDRSFVVDGRTAAQLDLGDATYAMEWAEKEKLDAWVEITLYAGDIAIHTETILLNKVR